MSLQSYVDEKDSVYSYLNVNRSLTQRKWIREIHC